MSSTLKGQIVIVLMWSLPFSMLMLSDPSGFSFIIISVCKLVIPLIVFGTLFGRMKTGIGVEFKFARILISSILWIISWKIQAFDLNHFLHQTLHFDQLTVCYDIITLSLTVMLSYFISKIIYSMNNRKTNT